MVDKFRRLLEDAHLDLMLSLEEAGPKGKREVTRTDDEDPFTGNPSTHFKVKVGNKERHYRLDTDPAAETTTVTRHFPKQTNKDGTARRPKVIGKREHDLSGRHDPADDRDFDTRQHAAAGHAHDDAAYDFHQKLQGH
jgi:hypothetical protein